MNDTTPLLDVWTPDIVKVKNGVIIHKGRALSTSNFPLSLMLTNILITQDIDTALGFMYSQIVRDHVMPDLHVCRWDE